jgi:hypothetical protein
MKRRPPFIRFARQAPDPEGWLRHCLPRAHRVTITLPDLPDGVVRCWHEFLRECLLSFEDHYEGQLARAYGWAESEENDEDDEEGNDWGDDEI